MTELLSLPTNHFVRWLDDRKITGHHHLAGGSPKPSFLVAFAWDIKRGRNQVDQTSGWLCRRLHQSAAFETRPNFATPRPICITLSGGSTGWRASSSEQPYRISSAPGQAEAKNLYLRHL
jgi:hypothetical protein